MLYTLLIIACVIIWFSAVLRLLGWFLDFALHAVFGLIYLLGAIFMAIRRLLSNKPYNEFQDI